jgi:hypothetical protein
MNQSSLNKTISVNSVIISKSEEINKMSTVSQIINAESIMKVFISDKEDLNAKNEVSQLVS